MKNVPKPNKQKFGVTINGVQTSNLSKPTNIFEVISPVSNPIAEIDLFRNWKVSLDWLTSPRCILLIPQKQMHALESRGYILENKEAWQLSNEDKSAYSHFKDWISPLKKIPHPTNRKQRHNIPYASSHVKGKISHTWRRCSDTFTKWPINHWPWVKSTTR